MSAPLFELREYRLHADGADAYLRRFASDLVPRMAGFGFDIAASWIAEPDEPGVVTFVWLLRWPDRPTRDAAFARLTGWEGWAGYRESTGSLVVDARNRFLAPFPLQ